MSIKKAINSPLGQKLVIGGILIGGVYYLGHKAASAVEHAAVAAGHAAYQANPLRTTGETIGAGIQHIVHWFTGNTTPVPALPNTDATTQITAQSTPSQK